MAAITMQIGLLKVLSGGSNELFRTTTALRVFKELHARISGQSAVESLQVISNL